MQINKISEIRFAGDKLEQMPNGANKTEVSPVLSNNNKEGYKDTFEKKEEMSTGKKVAIGTGIFAAVVGGIYLVKSGKGKKAFESVKKFFKKDSAKAEKEVSKTLEKTVNVTPKTETVIDEAGKKGEEVIKNAAEAGENTGKKASKAVIEEAEKTSSISAKAEDTVDKVQEKVTSKAEKIADKVDEAQVQAQVSVDETAEKVTKTVEKEVKEGFIKLGDKEFSPEQIEKAAKIQGETYGVSKSIDREIEICKKRALKRGGSSHSNERIAELQKAKNLPVVEAMDNLPGPWGPNILEYSSLHPLAGDGNIDDILNMSEDAQKLAIEKMNAISELCKTNPKYKLLTHNYSEESIRMLSSVTDESVSLQDFVKNLKSVTPKWTNFSRLGLDDTYAGFAKL